ncbi:MAG: Magnesium-translocating P-type ATPase [Candidatus Falkowbacteria bacterium GW2011_GWF2_39_8]|uniref:Magnesium-transporting ATPase, P-type 1 n=1 Tax=Candidatus Falkowbacteria bacterium GW2011_GWF2_39_8 TaxID=1618642 RepID=A0A0G0Q139_9BACT|nr:MAG: Magnesium-translocating P-type ATPase [Candidatus Falkowbacteria bacterium GW2011_GWF2_39_8]
MQKNFFDVKESLEKLFKLLSSSRNGLEKAEVEKRLKFYGHNEIAQKKRISPLLKFLSYFKDPLVLILIVAAVISGITGENRGAIIIITMVLLSVILNFYQEHKSSKSALEIAKKLATKTTALRDGKLIEILAKDVVPGDIISLSAGDKVPADGRLIQADDFFVNESILTGESFPNKKSPEGDITNSIIYSGTNVVSGFARFLVVNTGSNTEYGQIAKTLATEEESSAFEIGIKSFGYLIIKAIVGVVLLVFLINAFYKKDIIESLIFSIAIAVGIAPELLPMILSVNMSKGSVRMAKKGVLVKRLNAIPDFGSMDILCTDKTGTLTEDRITVVKYVDVQGQQDEAVLRLAYINGTFETGIKSLLDKALLDFKKINIGNLKKIDEIPYDFTRKRSSIIYEENGNRVMSAKGAPEEIFKICTSYLDKNGATKITPALLKNFNQVYEDLSNQGYRVLAVAFKDVADKETTYHHTEESEMSLAGFIAFMDPPKQSAKETLIFMEKHGVEIKILTGDCALVTKKICEDLGLPIKGIISGDEIDINKMNDNSLAIKVANATILARLSPIQKERIIIALRKAGNVVGYLGDGINDAPSLKSADVGISVENAVEVAKETADIILMKKGLKELMDGVIEGRKSFGNTMKYLMMGLSSNFGNMFSMIGAAIYLPFFPMLPGQILVNNFLYDMSQVAIPLDKVDDEYLKKPKHWDIKFIKNFMLIFGPISSLFDFLTFYLLFAFFGLSSSAFQTGWFIESLATQTLVIYIIRTRKIPFLQSSPSKYLLFSTVAVITLGLILIQTFLGNVFGFTPLPWKIIFVIFGLVAIYLVLVEIVKQFFYKHLYKKTSL